MRRISDHGLIHSALKRDRKRCARCGQPATRVYALFEPPRKDCVATLSDVTSLCNRCSERCLEEQNLLDERKRQKKAQTKAQTKAQIPMFAEEWNRKCEPRQKFKGDLRDK